MAVAVEQNLADDKAWKDYDFGDSKTDLTKVTYTTSMPAIYKDRIAKMEAQLSTVLVQARVPYALIANIADQDYVTLADVSQRFATKAETVNKETATEFNMGKGPDKLDYEKKHVLMYLRRLAAASQDCQTLMTHRGASQAVTSDPSILQHGQADQLRAAYKQVEGTSIPLDYEGSECYIKKQLHYTQAGKLGAFTNKQIISGLPDYQVTKEKIQTTTTAGWSTTFDESRTEPDSVEKWKHQMRTFYYTLTMCIHNCTNHPLFLGFKLDHIKDYYEEFIFSDEILKNRSNTSLKVVMIAERKAWNLLLKTIYKKETDGEPYTLTQALLDLKARSMWWTSELAHRRNDDYPPAGRGKGKPGRGKGKYGRGKGNGTWSQPSNYRSTYNPNFQKGKRKDGTKGRGKPGKKGKDRSKNKDKKGKDKSTVCNNFHYYQGCAGNCGRSHRCPECGEQHRWKDHHQ